MTNDGWGSKWPSTEKAVEDWIKDASKHPNDYGLDKGNWITHTSDITPIAADLKAWPNFDKLTDEKMNNASGVPWPEAPALTGLDLGIGERTVLTTFEDGEIKHKVIPPTDLICWLANSTQPTLKRQGSNLIDNDCHLYFQCEGCDTILDPNTKSFRVLQEARAKAGWIVKWNVNGQGYKVYCKKCGEKVA